MSANTNIVIGVDATSGIASLKALQGQVQNVGQSLRGLSSQSGFQNLASQVNASSSAFSSLAKSLASVSAASRSIATMSSSGSGLASMSRGAHDARNAVQGLTSALNPLNLGIAALSATIGALSLSKFVSDTMAAGTAALNLRIAVDSIAASGGESSRALAFVRKTAMELGAPLDTLTKQYTALYTSARALGQTPETIEKIAHGMATAMSALHISQTDQKTFYRELSETFSIGHVDGTRLMRSMALHVPGLAASVQQALGVTGEKMHHMLKFEGGIPLDMWEKLADLFEKRYGGGVATALQHAQGAVISLSNSFELLKQKTFDQGLDSGFATLANTVNNLIKPNIDSLSQTLGTMFRAAGAGASLFVSKLYEMRDSLTTVAQIIGGYAVISTTFRIAAAGAALLLSPLGLAMGLTLALQSQWETLGNVLSGSDSAFKAGSNYIKNLTGNFIDLERAVRGGVKMWEMFKSLAGGSSFADAQKAAVAAAQQFDAGEYGKRDGSAYAKAFEERLKRITDALKGALPGLPNLSDDFKKLYDQSAPVPFESHGDYNSNQKNYDAISANRDLSESLKKVWEALSPTNKALETYKEQIRAISEMRGKLDPLGHTIGDAEIKRLKDSAREQAIHGAFPATEKISELMERVKLEHDALANVGSNSSKEALAQEREFLRISVELKKKRVELTNEEASAIKSLIAAEHTLAKGGDQDPFSRWANSQKSAQDSLNDSISSGMDALGDGLARAVTSGKDLRSTLQGVLKEISANFLRAGIKSLMSDGIKQLNVGGFLGNLTGGKDSIASALSAGQGVLDRANGSLDKLAEESLKSVVTPNMDVQAAVVNINGGIGGASGLNSFKPGSSIENAINPKSVGGVLPKNDNGPLFSNPLPDFKSGAKVGGLSAIPSNSAALFGAGLNPSQALGVLPEFGKALKSSSDSISRNSVAEFGKVISLQKLAPVAERIGVTKPTFPSVTDRGLEEMYRNAGLSKATEANLRGIHPDLQRVFLRAKEISGQTFTMNHGQGLRSQAEADRNAARGLGIRNSQHLEGTAGDVNLYRNGRYIANGADPAYRQFNGAMQQAAREYGLPVKWGGDFRDYDHWQLPRGWKGAHKLGANQSGIDMTSTGSIGNKIADQSKRAQQAMEQQANAAKRVAEESQKASQLTQQMAQPLSGFDGGITKLSENLSQGVPAADSFTGELEKLIQKLLSGIGGGGGGIGDAVSGVLGGLFSEGGYTDSPVASAAMPASFWAGAPHFAEGTPNTSGGMPAILHDNEAVIPLSRGREIPVRLEGAGAGAGSQTIVQNFSTNVTARDHDSFRRNHAQVLESMQKAAGRARARNG